jgi:vacuolar-type H+-ATPase subunit I/STV1
LTRLKNFAIIGAEKISSGVGGARLGGEGGEMIMIMIVIGVVWLTVGTWLAYKERVFERESWIGTRRIFIPFLCLLAILLFPLFKILKWVWKAVVWLFSPLPPSPEPEDLYTEPKDLYTKR